MEKIVKYLSDALGHMVEKLIGQKVVITAPTGVGKTTFIIKELIPYIEKHCKRFSTRNKILILVNRKLLKEQCISALLKAARCGYISYESWDVLTYQEIESRISKSRYLRGFLSEYSVIVADEAHYFYHDAAFNNQTMKCLYALLYAGYSKTMIFMSATMNEVTPFIEQAWKRICVIHEYNECQDSRIKIRNSKNDINNNILIYNNIFEPDYSRFISYVVDSYEELACYMCNSEYKSMIFVDNRVMEKKFTELLKGYGAEDSEIGLIHSDNIDSGTNKEIVSTITETNRLKVKYLVSTSVMDNGVSVEDPDLRNVCIVTTSRLSFIQMLGRVRVCEGVDNINLIFVRQERKNYSNILSSSKRLADEIDKFISSNMGVITLTDEEAFCIQQKLSFGTDDAAKALRSIMTLCFDNPCYFSSRDMLFDVYPLGVNTCYVVNKIAVSRLKDAYHEARAVYDILSDEEGADELIRCQLSWIGLEKKQPREIVTNVKIEQKEEMKNELLKINNFDKGQFSKTKCQLGKKYFKKLYPHIGVPSGDRAIDDDKLTTILKDVGLCLKKHKNKEGRMRYFVEESSDDTANEDI